MRSKRREPSKAEAKRIAKLEAQQRRLQDRLDDADEDMTDEQAQATQDEMDSLGNELESIERALVVYPPRAMATAGAVVSLDHMGGVVVHRGLLREEQAKALREQGREGQEAGDDAEDGTKALARGKATISEKLVKRLSAHRTAALQAEVARHPQVALVAVVHRLALHVVHQEHSGSPLNITANPQDRLEQYAPDVAEAPAAAGMRQVREAWAERLPSDPDALFAELLAMPQQEVLSLLALCVGFTVAAIASRESEVPAEALARAVGLDMHAWWTPTAAGYFDHVAKATALEGVQAFAPAEVERLGKLKKAEIASEAERLVAGTGWLPAMFQLQALPVVAESQAGAPSEAQAPESEEMAT
jgi:ParB family chromosome partitioning protein